MCELLSVGKIEKSCLVLSYIQLQFQFQQVPLPKRQDMKIQTTDNNLIILY